MPPTVRRTITVTITETWTLVWGEPQVAAEQMAPPAVDAPAKTASWSVERVSMLSTVSALPSGDPVGKFDA